MRLSGQAKLGYFPTPETQLPLIASWLALADEQASLMRVLDPCCGQGEALAYLADHLGRKIATFGIELSPQRAAQAEGRLDHVLNTDFENAVLTEETFSLVLLNPPYDGSDMTGGGERMEYTFLTASTRLLVRGGMLVYILTEPRISEKIARHLAGWYEDLRCFRFAGEDYADFKQVVVFGLRCLVYNQPSSAEIEAVLCWSRGQVLSGYREETDEAGKPVSRPVFTSLIEIHLGSGEYQVPPTPARGTHGAAFSFRFSPVSVDDFLEAGERAAQALERTPAWLELIPQTTPLAITPAITPKLGHVSMQVSGGLLGTNRVTAPDGRDLLIKGGTEKFTVRVDDENEETVKEYDSDDPDQRKRFFRVRVEERSRPVLSTLDETGNLVRLDQPEAIREVLRAHVARLARQLEERNLPRYDRKPLDWEWEALAPLSPDRELPGRRETGLTAPQKHFSIALGRLLLAQSAGLINGEMAVGKTSMALAVAEYLREALAKRRSSQEVYPVLVVGPGIVTGDENWPREVREVIPGATSRTIEVAARSLPKPARVKDWARAFGVILDEGSFSGLSTRRTWLGVVEAAQKQGRPLEKAQRFALWSTLKWAEAHPPALRKGAEHPNLLDARIGGYLWLGLGDPSEVSEQGLMRGPEHARETTNRYSLVQFIREYREGALPEKSFAILSYETAKLSAGRLPAMPTRRMRVRVLVDGQVQFKIARFCTCPGCGQVVSSEYDEQGQPLLSSAITPGKSAEQFVGAKRRFCQAPIPRRTWNPEKGRHELKTHTANGRPYVCGTPLFAYAGLRREAAARYLQRKAPKAFPLVVVDEIHAAKAKGTGNGWALGVLANQARFILGLTGTLFGGYATDVYWLMYRLSGALRREFGFHDEGRWVQKVGLRRFTFYVTHPENVQEDGSYTGRQYLNRVDEKPGILPAIIRYGLPNIVFASLQDMDLPLPPYSEEMAWLELTPAMQAQYGLADGSGFDSPLPGSLYAWAIEEMKAGTPGALSVWLNAALNRPDAMFRDETVVFNRRISGKGKYAIRREEEVMKLPAIEPVSPKDLWLTERCLAERRAGRRSLVFVRQTGKRDLQPHVAEVLQEHGLRVGVLSPSVAPRSRVGWIRKRAPHLDVLLTNARLVNVGLNLRMFNTAIFYEIEWSLAILWQAMRRVYRPGAPLPVRVIFPAYAGTLEERALSLLGQKMKAASLFYGDEVSSALTEEDEGDFLADLVRSVLKKEAFARAESIFASENDLTASPAGSPTAISPQAAVVMTLQEWLEQRGISHKNGGRRHRGEVPAGQCVLPF
jgi:SAM-dependent methyltransferase